jgi:DNA-binding response OmpR family regulator
VLAARIQKVLDRMAQTPVEREDLVQRDDLLIDVRKHEVTIKGLPASNLLNAPLVTAEVLNILFDRFGIIPHGPFTVAIPA